MVYSSDHDGPSEAFAAFVAGCEPRLRRALVARYGREGGRDALAEALAYAWEHWSRVASMDNPAGYVYRVATSRARRHLPPWERRAGPESACGAEPVSAPNTEPRLAWALGRLSDRQRVAVLLVHGWGYPQAEAARLLDISESTLPNHLNRGIDRLRLMLEVSIDA